MAGYLVNFGDSWAHGDGHLVRNHDLQYSQLLAGALGRELIDLSVPSTSISHLVLQFRQFVQDHYEPGRDYLALFFVTAQQRQLAFSDTGRALEINPNHAKYQTYYETVYTEQLGTFTSNTALMTLGALCRYYGITDRYILGWQPLTLWPEHDRSRFYGFGQTTAMHLLGEDNIVQCANTRNPNFIQGDGHPSVKGHALLAALLRQWLTTDSNSV